MFAYSGLPLPDPDGGADVAAWIAENIRPAELFPLATRTWPGAVTDSPLIDTTVTHFRPVYINSLWWPWGAQRFARAHFVVDDKTLDAIRANVYSGGVARPNTLVFSSDGQDKKIAVSLWMLPPTPLQQTAAGSGMWLMTLVDDRYWWWGQPCLIQEPGSWTGLYSSVSSAIGRTIAVDPIVSAYGTPVTDYTSIYGPLPMVLDAIAFSVQQRIVVDYNTGNVRAMNASTAINSVTAQLAVGYTPYSGGRSALTPI